MGDTDLMLARKVGECAGWLPFQVLPTSIRRRPAAVVPFSVAGQPSIKKAALAARLRSRGCIGEQDSEESGEVTMFGWQLVLGAHSHERRTHLTRRAAGRAARVATTAAASLCGHDGLRACGFADGVRQAGGAWLKRARSGVLRLHMLPTSCPGALIRL
jgi:hypothetical protein